MAKANGRVEIACAFCGTRFSRTKYKANQWKRHFCSNECRNRSNRGNSVFNDRSKPKVEKPCSNCGKIMRHKPSHFKGKKNPCCSRKCLAEYQRKVRKTAFNHRRTSIECECDYCGKIISRQPHRLLQYKHKFCSHECRGNWMSQTQNGSKNPAWIDGRSSSYSRGSDWKQIKKAIRKRDGYTCQLCGIKQSCLPNALDVHHIERYSDFPEHDKAKANSTRNLISLCRSCHIQVEYGTPLQLPLSLFSSP